jgi:pimeloyl-ACP methyl ester carboxylesterase
LAAPGAEAYRRDNPNAVVEFLDSGHFALETNPAEMAAAIDRLLSGLSS